MFGKAQKQKNNQTIFLNSLYDFILTATLTERERKIGTLAKRELENGVYLPAVLNKLSISFQKEALKSHLSPAAAELYQEVQLLQNKVTPLGTARGSILFSQGYLD